MVHSPAGSAPRNDGAIRKALRSAWSWVGRILEPGNLRQGNRELVGQTERFTRTILVLGVIALIALFLASGANPGQVRFFVWALAGAFASALVGAAFGLLFGLPTVEAKREAVASAKAAVAPNVPPTAIPTTAKAPVDGVVAAIDQMPAIVVPPDQKEAETGYRESTSLEQIADWLTKIIVGLTLTQYAAWQDRFEGLSSNLTAAMMGAPPRDAMCAQLIAKLSGAALLRALDTAACRPSAIPGGMVIALFATAGFLVCYLWMRRYFILEMVIARRDALESLRADTQAKRQRAQRNAVAAIQTAEEQKMVDAAQKADLAEKSRSRPPISNPQGQLDQIFARAIERLLPNSPASRTLSAIRKNVQRQADPEDPWRRKFGPQSAVGFHLEATVTALADDPNYFKVDLAVRAERPGLALEAAGSRVMYFLHPTFPDQPRLSTFGTDGVAPLELFAYGAFTVGALLLENGTALELNLATLYGAPQKFLSQ